MTLIMTANAGSDNAVDVALNFAAQKILNLKVTSIYKKALSCGTLELDEQNGDSVKDWIVMEPEIPDWRMLKQLKSVAFEARDYAQTKVAHDKVKHCFAGCFIRKKLDLKSAVMIGWLKELSDSSDCTIETKFEKGDYQATVAGAIAGKNIADCATFCQRNDIKDATGEVMLEIATRESH